MRSGWLQLGASASFLWLFTELVDKPVLPGVCLLSPTQFSYTVSRRELPVTSEMTEKSYRAVRCFYCSEPIRLSTRLLELFRLDSDRTTADVQCQCQVFILRCHACSKEIRYLKSEIETFEGEPPKISHPNRTAGIRSTAS
jgi:hypothetical protein